MKEVRPFFKILIFFVSTFLCLSVFAQQQQPDDNTPSFKMNGDVSLLSNFVDKGLTQTEKDPSLQGNFSFNFGPQFRMGVFGSNVNYNSTEHFELRFNAELKVVISNNADFKFGYFDNHYYHTINRDGSNTYLQITVQGFRVYYETESDWEGTASRATYYAFGKIFELNKFWKWDTQVGYSMLKATGYTDYFDGRTTFMYKDSNNITYSAGVTATSAPTQFAGRGDVMGIVGASTTF